MERRKFLAFTAGVADARLSLAQASLRAIAAPHESGQALARQPIFVPSGFTREPDGTAKPVPSPSGMFDTEVIRSSDSDGRLATYVFPKPRRGCVSCRERNSTFWDTRLVSAIRRRRVVRTLVRSRHRSA